MGKCSIGVYILLILLIVPVPTWAESPLHVIETHVNKILDVLHDRAESKTAKEKVIWPIINEIFDYAELSKRTLANYWRVFTPQQQKEFTALFGKLLGDVYMDKILEFTNERVVFGREIKLSENTVEIQSEIITQTRSIPIYYRMVLEKGQWKVYDIVIEEVSLVMNYRSQFREVLSNKSPGDLMEILREKVRSRT